MIAYLKGTYTLKTPTEVIVDVHGVGYQVFVSVHTYSQIQNAQEGLLYTYLQIKEDAHSLYGFYTQDEKNMFIQLIGISGVGASTARLMLSSMTPSDLYKTITQGNTLLLEKIKGIGKKTAERIVLELKDKLLKQKPFKDQPQIKIDGQADVMMSIADDTMFNTKSDAIAALMALGFARLQAESAIDKALKSNPDIDGLENIIKTALQMLH